MILGFRLRRLRKEKNMSQEELGNILGVTKVSVSGYEKGTRVPSIDILVKILDVFNVSADYMFGRDVDIVQEDDYVPAILSSEDIEIIREIRGNPRLYNLIADDPKRFFSTICKNLYKKNI